MPSEEKPKSFMDSPTFTKLKGGAKIALGGLILLQPQYAIIIGGTICAGAIAGKVIQNIKGRDLATLKNDLFDGTFTKNLKDVMGMGAGATMGLIVPYLGVALAGIGALSFLARHPEGIDGLFKGGALATAVGTVGLPLVGGAFLAEGIANSLGYEPRLIGRSLEYAKGICMSAAKIIGIAEKTPDQPTQALNAAVKETVNGAKAIAPDVQQAAAVLSKEAAKVQDTIRGSDAAPAADKAKSWVDGVKSMLHLGSNATAVKEQRNNSSTQEHRK
jgi:hypothetical protein